jgi:PAS domain S-box-containing protein
VNTAEIRPGSKALPKSPTGISGLDDLTNGGLPTGRSSLLCGAAGCGKTLMAMTFLVDGAAQFDENGVFMSFEERSDDLVTNVASLGYDVGRLIDDGRLAIDYVRIEPAEIEQMKEGAITLNDEGLLLYANRSFGELAGRSASDFVGSSLFGHFVEHEWLTRMLNERQPASAEVSLVNASGKQLPVNLSVVELQVEAGAPRMRSGIVTDLSAVHRAEDALRQVHKMDAVGQLTGGIAHDFNNLLMAISSSLEMLRKRIPDDPQMHCLIANALSGTQRGAALTQRMRAFARRQDLKPERVDIPALARNMTDLVQRTLGTSWQLQLKFPDSLPPVLADANQLEMALLNLDLLGGDAMPLGGTIGVTAEQVEVAAEDIDGLPAGTYIRLRVIDNGEGMDAETLTRATEPFFTTKGGRQGHRSWPVDGPRAHPAVGRHLGPHQRAGPGHRRLAMAADRRGRGRCAARPGYHRG